MFVKYSHPQKFLSNLSNVSLANKTFYSSETTSVPEKNHLRACEGNGEWLSAFPSEVQLSNKEMRIACAYRLRKEVFKVCQPCARCQVSSDRLGNHAVICKSGPVNLIGRHDALRDHICATSKKLGLKTTREPVICEIQASIEVQARNQTQDDEVDASRTRADVLIQNWDFEGAALIDVTVCNSLKQQSMRDFKAIATFHQAANKKITKYKNRVRALGHHFFPFVVGTLGGFCPDAIKVLEFLSKKWELQFDIPAERAMMILRRQISGLMQKSLASQILDRGVLAEIMCV